MTIIIETPAPPTRERLVLVHVAGPGVPRGATPADLERAGYVPLAAFVGPLDLLSPPTLAGALEAVRAEQARAEKAARERDALRAEVARLTAPGEGSEGEPTDNDLRDVWGPESTMANARRAIYRLGVAHERARHAPAPCTQKDRATDEELVEVARTAYDWGRLGDVPWVDRIALAVAARVRQERCLVAQAVAANVDIRVAEDDVGFMVGAHAPGCDEELCRNVPAAGVPATLARLAGLSC